MDMRSGELNEALYQKMAAAQETYRAWLLEQPPEEILKHAHRYLVREDILLSLECEDLPDAQAEALLRSKDPLEDVAERFDEWETGRMGHISDAMRYQADAMIREETERQGPYPRIQRCPIKKERPRTSAGQVLGTVKKKAERGGR